MESFQILLLFPDNKYMAKIYYFFFFSKTLAKNRRIVKRKIKHLIHGYIIIVFFSFSRYNLYCSFKVSTTRKACSCPTIVKDKNHFLIFSLNKHFYVHTYISLILLFYHKQRRIRKIFPIFSQINYTSTIQKINAEIFRISHSLSIFLISNEFKSK